MKLFKKLAVALLITCSFMLVVPAFAPLFADTYTVQAASKPKMQVKVTKAKQQGKYYIVEGKVYNKTKSKLDSAILTINLYSKKNKKSKITTYRNSITYMGKKDVWKFSSTIYVGNKKVKSYKASAKGVYLKRASYQYTKLKTSKVKMTKKSKSSIYDSIKLKGKITNKTGKKLSDVFATIVYYDKKGNIVDTVFVGWYNGKNGNKKYKFSLKNKKSFNFNETYNIKSSYKVKKAKIVDVYGYSL